MRFKQRAVKIGPSKRSTGFKIKLIQFAKENGNRSAAKMFDIGESSIREWKKSEMTIINMSKKKYALRKRVMKWPILEESVANWALENRRNVLIVTRKCGTEDDYLFMEESNSDGENDTDFDDVPEDITEDEYADLFMLSKNESS
ncbi:hypothetical protein TNCV_3618611 [Trichonephila clavipes]|nr:hypothetical protein TNCV_3618611 [Trichonephila clavipes]